ncbi:MAG: HDOD domain-containing protein [Acidobacteriota bacterium]
MDLLCAPEARTRLRRWENLSPFHPVALRLMRAAASDDVPLTEVAAIVRRDAVFAAEILRLANSPMFGFRQEIDSVLHAVCLLGPERVRGLALTVALRRFLGAVLATEAARVCWRHNLACAMVAEELALALMMPSDAAYTAGLVHDLGRLALLASDPNHYAAMLAEAEAKPSRLCALEREAFGVDHCQAGATLMRHWGFPPVLCEVAAVHHQPVASGPVGVREIVQLACRTADSIGFQVTGRAPPFEVEELLQWLPNSAHARIRRGAGEMALNIAIRINTVEIQG